MNSRDIAYHIRRKFKANHFKRYYQPKQLFNEDNMKLSQFYLDLDALTNKSEAHPDIQVKIMTLDAEYPIGCIEIQKTETGDYVLYIQTDEPVDREPWD